MKKLLPALMALLLALTGAARAAEVVDGVAAIVNDKIITYGEVQDFVRPLVPQLRRSFTGNDLLQATRKAQTDALNTLIERALILDEFKKKGYILPETAVDNQITDIIANDYNNDRTAFIKSLETQNMTLSQFREKIRERIIVQAMANRKKQEQLLVSPYKMEQYYKEHIDDFRIPDQIKLRMLVIKRTDNNVTTTPPSATNGVSAAGSTPPDPRRTLAGEILAKLEAGESFDNLTRRYSEATDAQKGGDRGWVKLVDLRKEFSEPAAQLKAGRYSHVIEVEDGYYILFVEDVKPAHTQPLATVRDDIEKVLREELRNKMQEAWVKQLRAKAYIKIF
jgi:parvulin-like peptidyl-prolyl isomerase